MTAITRFAAAARSPDRPVDPQFTGRWSPRAFGDATIGEEELLALFEAARWAPSASNLQPWRLAWGLRGEPAFAAILATLDAGNRLWAARAAALVAVASKTVRITAKGEAVANPTHAFDAGAAWMSLALQAHLSGWAAHAMGGFDKAAAAAALHLPADCALHAVVAIGRPGDPAGLPETLRAREVPNGRAPVTDWAMRGRFAG